MTRYSAQIIDALFDAVENDDVVDPVVSLPDTMPVSYNRQQMQACLDLCIQFWTEGTQRTSLLSLTGALIRTGTLTPEARRTFKLIRARYKHLRFALVLYGARHKAPLMFRTTVVVMGLLQDAFKLERRAATIWYALLLRVLASWPVWIGVRREVADVPLDSAEGFRRFRKEEIDRLRLWLEAPDLNAHRFHAMRKVASRLVSFYDTARILEPDEDAYRLSRYLSAINGLMGSLHDVLVAEAAAGQRDYDNDPVELPADIRQRLTALAEAYPD
ncbi:hypothetical protein [Novosphingobium sp. 9]|uniref:hypothetical protein n=1 Tax=Novosphingobium sp. 9 TaxID=2025349 RepID=UPI0021B5AF8C|nr:hypothetical protein [Novosphingobium sp. 9]